MTRLLHNPIGDVTEPLGRIETSINKLGDQLEDVRTLPSIEDHLAETNRGIAAIVAALGEVHAELRLLHERMAEQEAAG